MVKTCDRSFISFGLSSNYCTRLYLDHASVNALFELHPEPGALTEQMYAQTADGREFHSDVHQEYGLIVRYAPDAAQHPERRWFLIAGLGPAGTIGAAWYLTKNWRYLASNTTARDDFVAFVSVPVIAPTTAHLESGNLVARKNAIPFPVRTRNRSHVLGANP